MGNLDALRNRVRSVAEHFALDLVEDKSGCIDPLRGPLTYSLAKGVTQ